MKRLFAILCVLCGSSLPAKSFDWRLSGNETTAAQFAAYHGETLEFSVTNRLAAIQPERIYYQTNGMGAAWWRTDGLVFAPSNDVGAASYRIFVRSTDAEGVNYTANGVLRMLPSPGFAPNALEPPIATLDFATVEVLNAPWEEIESRVDGQESRVAALEMQTATLEANKADASESHTFADGTTNDLSVVRSNAKLTIRAVETANGQTQFRLIYTK